MPDWSSFIVLIFQWLVAFILFCSTERHTIIFESPIQCLNLNASTCVTLNLLFFINWFSFQQSNYSSSGPRLDAGSYVVSFPKILTEKSANLQEMGCFNSKPNDAGAIRRRPGNIGEVAVFIPGLRVPESLELSQPLGDGHPRRLTERLAALRSRIVVMAAHEALSVTRPRKRTFTQHGLSIVCMMASY